MSKYIFVGHRAAL